MKTPRHIAAALAVMTIAVSAAIVPTAASAAPLCEYRAAKHQAVVHARPDVPITVKRVRNLFTVNGRLCGNATNRNTAEIFLEGDQTSNKFIVDLRGGALGPGYGAESGDQEIEIRAGLNGGRDTMTVIGSDGPDTLTFGMSGISLNTDRDADIKLYGPGSWSRIKFVGEGGNDNLRAMGGYGSNNASPFVGVDMSGGKGDDYLIPGMHKSEILNGDAGVDTVTYAQRFGGVVVKLDQNYNDGWPQENDNVDVENVVGTQFNDHIQGGAQNNMLRGYLGNDVVLGGWGDDTLQSESSVDGQDEYFGGPGDDKVNYTWREAGTWDVFLDNFANDGALGENDNAHSDIETIVGKHLVNPAEPVSGEIAP